MTDDASEPQYLSARRRLDALFELGCSWERIERTIKNVVELTEDQRAGLWLYGFLRHHPPASARVPPGYQHSLEIDETSGRSPTLPPTARRAGDYRPSVRRRSRREEGSAG